MTSDALQADIIGVDGSGEPAQDGEDQADPELQLDAVVEEGAEGRQQQVADVRADADAEDVEGVQDAADPHQQHGQDQVDNEVAAAPSVDQDRDGREQHSQNC